MSFKEILMVNVKCCINFTLSHIIPQKLYQINLNHFFSNLCSDNMEQQENNIYFQSTEGKKEMKLQRICLPTIQNCGTNCLLEM